MPNLCVVTVYVSDLQAARQFYCDRLGFEVEGEFGDCILQLKNEGVALILEKSEGDYPGESRIVIATQTDDLKKEMERLRNEGVSFIHDTPQSFPEGIFAACKDSSGNLLELIEFNKQV
ncbi:MAG: VOC family protein [Planctomycetota bacterium]